MQTKELRKLCAKLEEHRLLAVYVHDADGFPR